jgi:crossover junction endodeoxyribonuclease RuvC
MQNEKYDIIAGIDPGLVETGVCIIENRNNNLKLLYSKTIKIKRLDCLSSRLLLLNNEIEFFLNSFKIDFIGIEKTFININPKTSIDLAIAKGVILMNFAKFNIQYQEIEANFIKKYITGHGHSSKETIKNSLKYYINLDKYNICSNHEFDSIAIAICANFLKNNKIFNL